MTATRAPAILVAMADSGFKPGADVLDATRLPVIDPDGLPSSGDTDGFTGHGTAVTAFAAGDGNRDDNSVGVAWLNDIVHVDMFEETFPGTAYVTSLLSSIRQAIEAGSQIVNIGVGPSPMLAVNPRLATNFPASRVVFRRPVAPALPYTRPHTALPFRACSRRRCGHTTSVATLARCQQWRRPGPCQRSDAGMWMAAKAMRPNPLSGIPSSRVASPA